MGQKASTRNKTAKPFYETIAIMTVVIVGGPVFADLFKILQIVFIRILQIVFIRILQIVFIKILQILQLGLLIK